MQRITSNHIFSPSTFHWQCKKITSSLKFTLAPCGMSSQIFQLQSVHYLARFLHIFKRKSPNYNSHSSRQTKAEWIKTYISPQECNQTTIKTCATTQKQSAIGQPLCLKFVYFSICTTVLSHSESPFLFFLRWGFAASLWTSPQKPSEISNFPPVTAPNGDPFRTIAGSQWFFWQALIRLNIIMNNFKPVAIPWHIFHDKIPAHRTCCTKGKLPFSHF